MKSSALFYCLFALVVLIVCCTEEDPMMIDPNQEDPIDTTTMVGIEPIGLDTNNLTACFTESFGPFKTGTCRLKIVYALSESTDPVTGEITITNADTFNYRYNDLGQLVYHEGVWFRDSIAYNADGSVHQVTREDFYNDMIPPDIATYYYRPDGHISYIHYDKWYGYERVDSFYYNPELQLTGITQWSISDDGSLGRLLHDYSYDYYDKGLLRRFKEVSFECADFCNAPITSYSYFWNYTDFKVLNLSAGFYHVRKIAIDRIMLNSWSYSYSTVEIFANQGGEADLSEMEFNEYGYRTSRYYEIECFD